MCVCVCVWVGVGGFGVVAERGGLNPFCSGFEEGDGKYVTFPHETPLTVTVIYFIVVYIAAFCADERLGLGVI